MAGISSFFKSESFSDTKLLLLLPSTKSPSASADEATAGPSAPTSPLPTTTPKRKPAAGGRKRKAAAPAEAEEEEGDESAICIPAHRLILMAKSTYFSTRLSTAVGATTTSIIREHAACAEEVRAMEAVIEFMYTEKLPLLSSSAGAPPAGDGGSGMSDLQRLLLTLTVADRWQVLSCLEACCTAICAQPTAGMTWEDCYALYNLPEAVRGQPGVSNLVDFAATIAVGLANVITTAAPEVHHASLTLQLDKLPASVRLAMLEGCKLGFPGMLVLLSSDEAVADSEDSLAVLLSRYMKSLAGRACSPVDIKKLKDQLRYQHMSNTFIGLELPAIPNISLDKQQLSQMLYLRSLTGFDDVSVERRVPGIPAAWYKRARKQATPLPESVELIFNLREVDLAAHVKAVALMKSGGPAPDDILSDEIIFRGTVWRMFLQSTAHSKFVLVVRPFFGRMDNSALRTTGIYVKIGLRLNSKSSPITRAHTAKWISGSGWGVANFVQVLGQRAGDPTEIAWWKEYITDGHVRFSAPITYL